MAKFQHSRTILSILGLLCLLCLTQSQTTTSNASNSIAAIALKQISDGSEKFSLQLFQRLAQLVPDNYDFIISPFSIWSLLILTAEGAEGNTYRELTQVLGLPSDLTYIREGYRHIQGSLRVNSSTIELALNQVLFTDKNRPVDVEFEDKLSRVYAADQVAVDFHDTNDAYYVINEYVEARTNGKLGKVVQLEDLKDAQMLLISAIYFKGQWTYPFNASLTSEEPFYDEYGLSVGNVQMMYQKGVFAYTSIASLESHILELPYGQENRLSMIILLPKRGVSLQTVIQRIESYGVHQITAELNRAKVDYDEDEVEVYLPRLSTRADFTLNKILKDMGLIDIFDANRSNLAKISKQTFLSRIIHKAQIELNEEGTIASAATAGSFANKNTPPRFYANRPFAYLIVEKSQNLLLFCGQVKNPTIRRF